MGGLLHSFIQENNHGVHTFAFLGVVREFLLKEFLPVVTILEALNRLDNHTADLVFPGLIFGIARQLFNRFFDMVLESLSML